MKIGDKVKKIRTENNLTEKELAEILDVTYQSIMLYEQYKRIPRIGFIVKFLELFNIKFEEFMKDVQL